MFMPMVVNRFCKIFGTLVKAISYPIYLLFPKLRFTIPLVSKPKIRSNTTSKIPKILWQTNYTNRVTLPVYINYLFNRLMSLDWEYRYVSTEERLEFIRSNATKQELEAFEQLTVGASQADFWRLMVLNKIGGVYMDIDGNLVWPLSKIVKPDFEELFVMSRRNYSNYFIASMPNNRHLAKTLELIVNNIENRRVDKGVYFLTGPTALIEAIGDSKVNHRYYKITCIQGSFTNEHFQYLDKRGGKWTHAKPEDLLKN